MSEKCVHNWYSRIVGFASSEFFCLICGKKLTITRMEEHATELEARIAKPEKDNTEFRQLIRDWSIVLEQDDYFQLWHVESVRQAMLEINKECEK